MPADLTFGPAPTVRRPAAPPQPPRPQGPPAARGGPTPPGGAVSTARRRPPPVWDATWGARTPVVRTWRTGRAVGLVMQAAVVTACLAAYAAALRQPATSAADAEQRHFLVVFFPVMLGSVSLGAAIGYGLQRTRGLGRFAYRVEVVARRPVPGPVPVRVWAALVAELVGAAGLCALVASSLRPGTFGLISLLTYPMVFVAPWTGRGTRRMRQLEAETGGVLLRSTNLWWQWGSSRRGMSPYWLLVTEPVVAPAEPRPSPRPRSSGPAPAVRAPKGYRRLPGV